MPALLTSTASAKRKSVLQGCGPEKAGGVYQPTDRHCSCGLTCLGYVSAGQFVAEEEFTD